MALLKGKQEESQKGKEVYYIKDQNKLRTKNIVLKNTKPCF